MTASDASAGAAKHPAQAARKVAGEAFTAAWTGQPLSTETSFQRPTPLCRGEGNTTDGVIRESSEALAVSQTLSMSRSSTRGNREIPEVPGGLTRPGRAVQGQPRTTAMYASGKSDEGVVPTNRRRPSGRGVREGRPETAGNPDWPTMSEAQDSEHMMSGLERIREVARGKKRERFTSLLHHITVGTLEDAYRSLKRSASPGIDGVTWAEYGEDMATRLADLHDRVHGGRCRAQPSKRAWIPKADGTKRPLGIAALEDKIVQLAVSRVMQAIFEEDFAGFSYGFRPGRGQYQALDAVVVGIERRKVNWIVDADIKGFFDTIDHGWLMKFIEHRIADPRLLRLLRKWLRAGVSEQGEWAPTTVGTPQGAVISPLLANIYLHQVLDVWMKWWRSQDGRGETIIVRYADDFVVGFQHKTDAEQFLHDLRERLAKFALTLHPDKTRLIEFGRFAAGNRLERGEGKPETFNFLGFTHRCAKRRSDGRFTVIRTTMTKRLGATVQRIGQTLTANRALPIVEQGRWLTSVVRGWLNYHAVPGNSGAIHAFKDRVIDAWRRSLRRRSQRAGSGTTWAIMRRLSERYLPPIRILHPYPNERLCVIT